MHRSLALSAIIATLIAAGTPPALGQFDPATQLVGKWEGAVRQMTRASENRTSEDRTLVISSMTQHDGKWIGEGRFAVMGQRGVRVQIEVDTTGQWPSLQWTMPNGNVARVNLIDRQTLSGKIVLSRSGEGHLERPLTLVKVQ